LKPTAPVVPEKAHVELDGRPAKKAQWRTILFHKPRGVVTTRSDPEGRRTVYDVLGDAGRGLVAVGRLDLATTGLLLLTTDTRLSDWLTDPANAIPRLYVVTVRGRVRAEDVHDLPGAITIRKASERETHLVVELREGKNRQVRRMFADIGHEVTSLKRVRFGGLELGAIQPGEYREVLHKEMTKAFRGAPHGEV
jgi:pseudouridine synthase